MASRKAVASGRTWLDTRADVERLLASRTPHTEAFQELITRYARGEIRTREGLPRHTRSLLTIAKMVALDRGEELALHPRAARNNGVSRAEIGEVPLQSAICCGVPAANPAFRLAQQIFAEQDAAGGIRGPAARRIAYRASVARIRAGFPFQEALFASACTSTGALR